MSHRDRDPEHAADERGNDWLDGALAGWLLFVAISLGNSLLADVRAGRTGSIEFPYKIAIALLAVASIVPLLRFHRIGWYAAALVLLLMSVIEAADVVSRPTGWLNDAPFLAVHLMALGYLLYIRPEFWHEHAEPEVEEVPETAPADEEASAPAAAVPAPRPIPVTMALAAIHHRIVAAGSACAVAPVAVRAEAGRFGVTPGMLRNEGLTLYGTFLTFFLSDGPLTADEERELACLERALDLDYTSVQTMRVDAGVVRSIHPADAAPGPFAAPAPPPEPESVPLPADAEPADFAPPPEPIAAPLAEADIEASAEPVPAVDEAAAADWVDTEDAHPDEEEPAAAPEPPDLPIEPDAAAGDTLEDYEEHELTALLRWAGVPRPAGGAARAALERLRALHRTATEPLEACASDHPLEPGERCIAIRTVELYRLPPGAALGGGAADVPAPVLDPRSLVDDSLEVERDLSGFQRAGVCRFLLTDRRLLLVAPNGQQSPLPLDRVRAVQPYRNGLEVRPLRGSPVFLAFTGGADDVAMRVDRAVRDLRARPA